MEKHTIDKKLFFKFVQLLEAHSIFFWLEAGTLLGAYREKGFISGDDDIDISLWAEDYWKIRKIIDLSDWKYKSLWRKEIAVYHEDNPNFHIDLFFFDKEDNQCATYSYLENKITKDIHVESKIIIPSDLLSDFKTINFYKHKFNIPNQTAKYLECQYGNWKEKPDNWYYSKKSNIDRNHCSVGIIIPTFLRPEKLINCVNSIFKIYSDVNRFQTFFKIYIGEQGEITQEKAELYHKLEEMGHKIFKLPYNCGLSYTRNYLISQVKEPYILVIDDDYIFTEESHLEPFFRLLVENENIGIVAGKLKNREQTPVKIFVDKPKNEMNILTHIILPEEYIYSIETKIQKSVPYFESEYVLNFFIAKKEMFDDIKWDNELKLVEHTDFMLRLKTTKWKTVYTPTVIVEHHPENNSAEYQSYRDSKEGKNCILGLNKFRQKYNIRGNNKWIFPMTIKNEYLKPSKIKIVQIARIPCANSGFELSNLINKYSDTFESRYILGTEYSGKLSTIPYRKFPMDLYWQTQKEECLKILNEADIVHIHHDIINEPEIIAIIKNKKVIWTLYNLSQSLQYENNKFNCNYITKCKSLSNVITVADQSLQRKMFSDITDIKLPLIKVLFDEQIIKNNPIPLIVYAPTNRVNAGIATKKYSEVLKIIEELKNENYLFEFDLIEGVPYEENLDRKRKADILIDDVDPNYEKFHNSSIEAACFGAIPLTNYTGLDYPFTKTDINNLKETLIKFITNPNILKEEQNKITQWVKNNYTAKKLINIYEQIYYDLINGKYFLKENIQLIEPTQDTKEKVVKEEIKPQINLNIKDIVKEIIQSIHNLKIDFWILKNSCYETLTQKNITSDKFYIGVKSIVDKNIIINQLMKYSTFIDIQVEPKRETKNWELYGLPIKVPCPLVKYIENYTKKSWTEIQKEIKHE